MPGTFPNTNLFKPIEVDLTSQYSVQVDIGHNLTVQRRSNGAQRFQLKMLLAPIYSWAEFAELDGFLERQKGETEYFDIEIPRVFQPVNGAWSGNELVNGNQSAGATEIDIDTASNNALMKAGDLIQFSSHTKIYKLVQDVTLDGTGAGTITINTGLVEDIVDNESVKSHRHTSPLLLRGILADNSRTVHAEKYQSYGAEIIVNEVVES